MRQLRVGTASKATSFLASGALVLVAVTIGTSSGSAGAAPSAQKPAGRAATLSGEGGQITGPNAAPVDAAHATPAASRNAAFAAHHHVAKTTASTSTAVSASELDPAVYGQWSTLAYQLPLRAIHVTLLRTGKFLLIAGSGGVANDNVIGHFKAYLWDPSTGSMTSVPVPYDAFCGGHLVNANGDVIIFGGTVRYKDADHPWVGSNKAYKFVVATSTWVALHPMKQGRWYPTALIDGHGRYLAYSGKNATGATPVTPEMYHPVTNTWTSISRRTLPLYPGLHLLQDGRIAYTGAHTGGRQGTPMVFNPTTGERAVVSDPSAVMDLAHRNTAMSSLVGSADQQLVWVAGGGFPAVRSTYFIHSNAATPVADAGPDLPAAKGYLSVSHLPDLTALETGGGTARNSPVFEASILNPLTSTLTPMAPPSVPRTYHSSALTMPDGRVVTFGGDPTGDLDFELRVEIFSPPYLFKGPRPTVTSNPTEVRYGATYTVAADAADGATLTSAVLMRPGSATHSMDANQRTLELMSRPVNGGIKITLPSNANLAPPGWYLLFVNDSLGRPSIGQWVHLL